MDTYRNELVKLPEYPKLADAERYIPFDIGEEVVVKGYRFKVAHVDIGKKPTLLVLEPLGKL